ncbi:EF-hand domain-containing protein [Nonomuraea insulae]|uniref:EF-hand domain-containing protein n=1 Tax=Nonomuraea insulae TaxID=1616787 RepID=A0ABW1CQX8_9ACTN
MVTNSTEYLAQKFRRRFDLFDANGDGQLEKEDFEATAQAFLDTFDVPEDSPRGRAVRAAYAGLWNALIHAADDDRDGRLTPAEFTAYLSSADFRAHGYDVTFGRVAEAVIAVCDTSGDGLISYPEFQRVPGVDRLPEPERRAAFEALDKDGSGTLDLRELQAAQRQYYTSDDPGAPGNLLFGRI